MAAKTGGTFYGWFVVMGCSLVALGTAGTQFSFGVFLQPMTEEFGWSRSTLSLAFGITFMLSGLLRPLAGYLADRYSPKLVALSGVALLGVMLLIVPSVKTLVQLYAVFAVMSIGLTMGVGPRLLPPSASSTVDQGDAAVRRRGGRCSKVSMVGAAAWA